MPKIGVFTHLRPEGPSVIADLDTLLIALYVELTDRIIPTLRPQDRHRDYCGRYQAVQEMPPEKRSGVEAEEGPT